MMQLPVVGLDDWIALEDALAVRYRKSGWRAQQVLKGLVRFPYWKIPTSEEARAQTGGLSRTALHRRRIQAATELSMMEGLPQLSRGVDLALAEHRRAFGLPAEIVRPGDRELTLYHVWAIADRRRTADLICQVFGAKWIVPLAVLEEELERRRDEQEVALLKLHQARARESKAESPGGPQCILIDF